MSTGADYMADLVKPRELNYQARTRCQFNSLAVPLQLLTESKSFMHELPKQTEQWKALTVESLGQARTA